MLKIRDRQMSAYIQLNAQTNHLDVVGVINIDNVVRVRKAGAILIEQMENPVMNLEQVVTGDSTVLALLTAWVRDAKKSNRPLRFSKIPSSLLNIAKLNHLDELPEILAAL